MKCVSCQTREIDQDMVEMGTICPDCFHDPVTGRKINDYGWEKRSDWFHIVASSRVRKRVMLKLPSLAIVWVRIGVSNTLRNSETSIRKVGWPTGELREMINCKDQCRHHKLFDPRNFEGRGFYCCVCVRYMTIDYLTNGKCGCCKSRVRLAPRTHKALNIMVVTP